MKRKQPFIEEDGAWLSKTAAAASLGTSTYNFIKNQAGLYKQRTNHIGNAEFFVPFEKMLPESAANYQRMLDEDPVIDSDDDDASGLETMLMNARLENIKARTKTLEEKLEAQRETMWREWSEAFFDTFTEAFAKFKNDLISLRLNEEQLNVLTEKLEKALNIMRDKLDFMYAKFKKGDGEVGGDITD